MVSWTLDCFLVAKGRCELRDCDGFFCGDL